MVANRQPHLFGKLTLKRFHISDIGIGIPVQRSKNAHRRRLVDGANLGWYIWLEANLLHARLILVTPNLFHSEAALGDNLFERHATLGILAEVFAGSGNGPKVVVIHDVVIHLIAGMHHYRQQMDNGLKLVRPKLFHQLMSLLFGCNRVSSHCFLPASQSGAERWRLCVARRPIVPGMRGPDAFQLRSLVPLASSFTTIASVRYVITSCLSLPRP